MKKYRVHTTISTKHWELLQKYTEEYETQQKVLEAALESLGNGSKKSPDLSPEEQYWMRIGREIIAASAGIVLHKDLYNVLIETADFELIAEEVANKNLMEYLWSLQSQKPFNKLNLKEVIDGIILNFKTICLLGTISCIDDDNCYILKIIHNINIKHSKLLKIFIEDTFNAYGVKTESEFYEKSLFIKVYKNTPA